MFLKDILTTLKPKTHATTKPFMCRFCSKSFVFDLTSLWSDQHSVPQWARVTLTVLRSRRFSLKLGAGPRHVVFHVSLGTFLPKLLRVLSFGTPSTKKVSCKGTPTTKYYSEKGNGTP